MGREFCEEAGIEDVDDIIAPFVSMHEILQGVRPFPPPLPALLPPAPHPPSPGAPQAR